jgi:hypothetical protein
MISFTPTQVGRHRPKPNNEGHQRKKNRKRTGETEGHAKGGWYQQNLKSQYNWGDSGNLVASEGAAAIELRGRDWALLKK